MDKGKRGKWGAPAP